MPMFITHNHRKKMKPRGQERRTHKQHVVCIRMLPILQREWRTRDAAWRLLGIITLTERSQAHKGSSDHIDEISRIGNSLAISRCPGAEHSVWSLRHVGYCELRGFRREKIQGGILDLLLR